MRHVRFGEHLYPSSLLEPIGPPRPGECGRCGGLGFYPERIDSEREDAMVPCFMCQRFCKACNKYVRKDGHTCKASA